MISITGIIIVVSLLLLILRKTGIQEQQYKVAVSSESIQVPVVESWYRDIPRHERSRLKYQVKELQESLDEMERRIKTTQSQIWDEVTRQELTGEMAVTNELLMRRDEMLDAIAQMNRRNRIVYLIADPDGRKPWIVEVRNDRLVLSTDEQGMSGFTRVAEDHNDTAEWLLDFYENLEQRDQYYLLLSVKPSGIELLREILAASERRDGVSRQDIGLDLIPEWASTTISFPGSKP